MGVTVPTAPDFRSPAFLRDHALWVLSFYGDQAIDASGGMYHYYLDDGTVYDRTTRHLVSATRFVVTQATGFELNGDERYRQRAAHALAFLEQAFRDRDSEGFHWIVRWEDGRGTPIDSTRHMYGLAFVMLAAARAHRIGIAGAHALLESTFELAERRFFDTRSGLYADDATRDWTLSGYRGQNANMHACEAMIAAYEATHDERYLARAEALAQAVTVTLAALAGGGIWEHYRLDANGAWSPDWDYNRHDRSNIFRPWGFQPGHFTEWAKLLCQLDRLRPQPWRVPRARELFDCAWRTAWDAQHGGLHYGTAPDDSVCDGDKYHWVQAESLAAAALIALASGEAAYWKRYDELWSYCWQHFVDHRDGAWFRILTRENFNLTREKSPAGKVDYHDIGACYDVWRALQR